MSGHLTSRGRASGPVDKRTDLVSKTASELEECTRRGHNSCKSAKRGAQKLQKAALQPSECGMGRDGLTADKEAKPLAHLEE